MSGWIGGWSRSYVEELGWSVVWKGAALVVEGGTVKVYRDVIEEAFVEDWFAVPGWVNVWEEVAQGAPIFAGGWAGHGMTGFFSRCWRELHE